MKRFGSYEHLKVRPIHRLKYRLWCHNYVIVVISQTFVTIVWNTSSLISVPNSMIIRAITQSYDGGPSCPPLPSADGSKKPMSNRVERLCSRQNFLWFNEGAFLTNIYMLITCTTFICQSICAKIPGWNFALCTVSLCIMKKNWKGPIARHEKTNALWR